MKVFFLMLLACFSNWCFAGNLVPVKAKVTKVSGHTSSFTTYTESEKGVFFIFMEDLPNACGDGMGRVAISHEHPLFETVVSVALLARTTGEPIEMAYIDKCTVRENSWDFGSFTY